MTAYYSNSKLLCKRLYATCCNDRLITSADGRLFLPHRWSSRLRLCALFKLRYRHGTENYWTTDLGFDTVLRLPILKLAPLRRLGQQIFFLKSCDYAQDAKACTLFFQKLQFFINVFKSVSRLFREFNRSLLRPLTGMFFWYLHVLREQNLWYALLVSACSLSDYRNDPTSISKLLASRNIQVYCRLPWPHVYYAICCNFSQAPMDVCSYRTDCRYGY